MRTLQNRKEVEAREAEAEAAAISDFYRRAALNKAVGMSARCPWAFQLTEAELAQAERDLAGSDPHIPIWEEPNGLRVLGDPWRI